MSLPDEQVLFMAASCLTDEEERRALLDLACRHDPDLRQRIDALFEVQDNAAAYFKPMPEPVSFDVAVSGIEKDELDTKVGRYQLIDRLGEGGCGVVYLA